MNRHPLRELREMLDLTAAQLATRLNISVPFLYKLEAGQRTLPEAVIDRLAHVFGAEIDGQELRTSGGLLYTLEDYESKRDRENNALREQQILDGVKTDVELLVRAARSEGMLHVLATRLHECLSATAENLNFRGAIDDIRGANKTITAGEIRAYARTLRLRRRRDRLTRKEDQLVGRADTPEKSRALAAIRRQLADVKCRIAEEMRRVNVRGRRKTIAHRVHGQIELVKPNEPNSTVYPDPTYPPFGSWWPMEPKN
jgi:transcriptional regulator with XRE-family HTH domain